jgi:hypothetical protein
MDNDTERLERIARALGFFESFNACKPDEVSAELLERLRKGEVTDTELALLEMLASLLYS